MENVTFLRYPRAGRKNAWKTCVHAETHVNMPGKRDISFGTQEPAPQPPPSIR